MLRNTPRHGSLVRSRTPHSPCAQEVSADATAFVAVAPGVAASALSASAFTAPVVLAVPAAPPYRPMATVPIMAASEVAAGLFIGATPRTATALKSTPAAPLAFSPFGVVAPSSKPAQSTPMWQFGQALGAVDQRLGAPHVRNAVCVAACSAAGGSVGSCLALPGSPAWEQRPQLAPCLWSPPDQCLWPGHQACGPSLRGVGPSPSVARRASSSSRALQVQDARRACSAAIRTNGIIVPGVVSSASAGVGTHARDRASISSARGDGCGKGAGRQRLPGSQRRARSAAVLERISL